MQQMFSCHKCGWQNVIGQRFCGSCGERFEYNCPHCGEVVDPSYTACSVCGAELVWGFQQTATPSPEEQMQQYQEQPQQYQQYAQQGYPEQPQQQYQQHPPEHPSQSQQPPQDQPKAPQRKQKGIPASKEEKLKQKRKNQMILILIALGLIFCIAVAIYLGIQALSPNQQSLPQPTISDNSTSLEPSHFLIAAVQRN